MSKFKHYVITLFLLSVFVLTGCGGGGGDGSGGSAVSEGSGSSGGNITCNFPSPGGQSSIVGSWAFGSTATQNNLGVLTLFSNGTYTIANDVAQNASEQDGMERGTYTWDPNTGAITVNTTINTDGTAGWSDSAINFCVQVNGNAMTITDSIGSEVGTRVVNVANSIVGSWYFTDPATPADLAAFTFFSDGTYTLADDGSCQPSDPGFPNCGGQDGMERGTYTFNAPNLTTTCPTVNSDGEWGLSHPTPGNCTGIQATVTFSNNGNTATITDSNGPFVLNRIAP